jgi:hypothetical protein
VVAYRSLTPIGMSAAERSAAVALWSERQQEPRASGEVERWRVARDAAVGSASDDPVTHLVLDYAHVENCLPDAFAHAEETLRARIAEHGPGSASVRHFVAGQDAAFANCLAKSVSV